MATLTARAALLTALLTATACQPAPLDIELTGGDIVFHALLSAGADQAVATLVRMPTAGSISGPPVAIPIRDATIEIRHAGSTSVLQPGGDDVVCYRIGWMREPPGAQPCYVGPVAGGVQPGATYELRVRLSDGRTVTGTTTVPLMPVLVEPASGARLPARGHGSLAESPPSRISWHGLPGELRAELMLPPSLPRCATTLPDGPGFGLRRNVTNETQAVVVPVVGCAEPAPPAEVDAEVLLAVYDLNYTRYIDSARGGRSVFPQQAASGLYGALGVFGAVAIDRRPVVLELR
jgi:hypothetical protein